MKTTTGQKTQEKGPICLARLNTTGMLVAFSIVIIALGAGAETVLAGDSEPRITSNLCYPNGDKTLRIYVCAKDSDKDLNYIEVYLNRYASYTRCKNLGPMSAEEKVIDSTFTETGVKVIAKTVPCRAGYYYRTVATAIDAAGEWDRDTSKCRKCKEDTLAACDLVRFSVYARSEFVGLDWGTATEIDNAGFNIHRGRAENGEYEQVNEELIPAMGSESAGASYSYTDTNVEMGKTYYYKLESVDLAGNSTWHGPISVTLGPTGVTEGQTVLIPDVFGLSQNYPNPFNVETDIRYQITDVSFVTLTIYSVLGQEVVTLVEETKEAGYHSVHWNGKDSAGQEASSGIYLYLMTAGDFTATKRMVLMK